MKNCPTCHLTYPNEFTLCPHDGGTLETKDQWSPGMVVRDKYRIVGPIGAGGMATVYKAEHIHFREVRALKVISPALSGDDGFVRRFMQEAVLTRRLHHPNAVRVDDIDRGEDGRPFIVMEFIDGICLRDAMRPQTPMPLERACRIAKQVASALGAAHDLGMVHRDIKPHNIFLANTYSAATRTVDGEQAKVLDFGIAKVKESQMDDTRLRNLTMTGAGAIIGTPAYMSPEQAAGKRGDDLDGRSDLYSLGVVLYQMLTGDLPLNADSEMQLMMAHMATEPVPIQQRLPNIPPQLAYLVMRSLAKEPSMRPENARAFVAEIEEIERSLAAPLETPQVIEPVAVIPDQKKTPSIPTKPRPQAVVAAIDPAAPKAPFFTTTKVTALVAMLVCTLALGAVTVINHFRNLSAARAAALLAAPPVNTAANNPPSTVPTPVPTDNAQPAAPDAGDQPAKPADQDDLKDPTQDQTPVVPPPVKSAPAKTPVPKVAPAKPASVDPSSLPAQTSGNFPEPKQSASTDPTAAFGGSQQPAGGQSIASNDPNFPGNSPKQSNPNPAFNGGGFPAANNQPMNNPQMGSAPAGNPSFNNPGNNSGFNNPAGRGDILPPSVVSKVEPKYSQEAKSFRYSGTTVLSVVVDEHGLPGDIRVLRATGYGLDKQAVDAVSRWRFSPGLRNGAPIRYRVGVQINFRYAGLFSFAKSSVFFQ